MLGKESGPWMPKFYYVMNCSDSSRIGVPVCCSRKMCPVASLWLL